MLERAVLQCLQVQHRLHGHDFTSDTWCTQLHPLASPMASVLSLRVYTTQETPHASQMRHPWSSRKLLDPHECRCK